MNAVNSIYIFFFCKNSENEIEWEYLFAFSAFCGKGLNKMPQLINKISVVKVAFTSINWISVQ